MAFRPGLQEIRSVSDPLLQFQWNVVFPTIPGSSANREFSYKAVSTSLPGSQVEQVKLEAQAVTLNFGGKRTWGGTWNLTMFESRRSPTRQALVNWMDFIRNWDANAGAYADEYKVTVELQLLDSKNVVMRTILLEGAWAMTIDDVSLDQSSAVVQYSCTFSYDRTREFDGDSMA